LPEKWVQAVRSAQTNWPPWSSFTQITVAQYGSGSRVALLYRTHGSILSLHLFLPVAAQLYNRWILTVAAGFFEGNELVSPTAIPTSFFDLFFALGCAPDDQAFLAAKNRDFVGGAVLNVVDGTAMLRTASTRYAYRNRGVHQALLVARLKCAREQGARLAVSQTWESGPSAHNLRKLGFQPFRFGCMMEKSIVQCARRSTADLVS